MSTILERPFPSPAGASAHAEAGAGALPLRDARYHAFALMRIGCTVLPLGMGIDKFLNVQRRAIRRRRARLRPRGRGARARPARLALRAAASQPGRHRPRDRALLRRRRRREADGAAEGADPRSRRRAAGGGADAAAALEAATKAWYGDAHDIAAFLSGANPHSWPLAAAAATMDERLRLTPDDAHTLGGGIVARFPPRFSV